MKITKVTKQVVAGCLFNITGLFEDKSGNKFNCELTIWERSWLDGPENLILELKSKEESHEPFSKASSSGLSPGNEN